MPDEGPCSKGESIQELATENVMAAAIRRTVFQPQQPAKDSTTRGSGGVSWLAVCGEKDLSHADVRERAKARVVAGSTCDCHKGQHREERDDENHCLGAGPDGYEQPTRTSRKQQSDGCRRAEAGRIPPEP